MGVEPRASGDITAHPFYLFHLISWEKSYSRMLLLFSIILLNKRRSDLGMNEDVSTIYRSYSILDSSEKYSLRSRSKTNFRNTIVVLIC
jgi:hypothetical protein